MNLIFNQHRSQGHDERNLAEEILKDFENFQKIPEYWNIALVHALHKKGKAIDGNDYRRLFL